MKKKLFWLLPLWLTAPSNAFGVETSGVEASKNELQIKAHGYYDIRSTIFQPKGSIRMSWNQKSKDFYKVSSSECQGIKIYKSDIGKYVYQYFVPFTVTWEKLYKFATKNFERCFKSGFQEINVFLHNCIPIIEEGEIIHLADGYTTKSISPDKAKFCKMIQCLAQAVMDPEKTGKGPFYLNLMEALNFSDLVTQQGKNARKNVTNNAQLRDKKGKVKLCYSPGISIDTKTEEQLNSNALSGAVRIRIQTLDKEKDREEKGEEAKKYCQELSPSADMYRDQIARYV